MDAQLDTGFESGSGFREAFNRIIGTPPSRPDQQVLHASWIDTPLGLMLAIADEEQLVLLEFVERRGLETELKRLRGRYAILPGTTAPLQAIERELGECFAGERTRLETAIPLMGAPFQTEGWEELRPTPYREAITPLERARRGARPH